MTKRPGGATATKRRSNTRSKSAPAFVGAGRQSNGHDKRAAQVADLIIADIIERGWPEGEVIGSEPQLLERYEVSRAVFREAVRLVEHQQVARMRRGPGGGLVVTTPTLEAVIDPVSVYLFYANARVDQVAEARMALEETVAELAPRRLSEQDIDDLRAMEASERAGTTKDHRELHALLAAITKNPALDVFVSLLNRLTYLYFPDVARVGKTTLSASAHAHVAIIKAVVAGDESLARSRMESHLEAEAEYLRRRVGAKQLLDASVLRSLGDQDKRGEHVARQVFVEVVEAGWPVGQLLGSEAELMERFDVSRAVLREAVRLLEHHQIAAMRRGPGGGLFVVKPGVESAAEAIALLLECRGIEGRDLFEVRMAIELRIVELAVKRLNGSGAARLRQALVDESGASREDFATVGHDLHAVVASLVGNPVFELLTLVLIRLTRFHQRQSSSGPADPSSAVLAVHTAIVDAIIDRDSELAIHRTRRHLEAMAAWVR
jgi:DNA-binding FadR family transcriptional regulator